MQKCDGVDWDYYDKYSTLIDKYLPSQGEGENMATQIVTAISHIIYKWYNDGDVYDNTHMLDGWCNDLSSYANWMYKYIPDSRFILNQIIFAQNGDNYETILKSLVDKFLDNDLLKEYENKPKLGSIYDCEGKFKYNAYYGENDEEM